MYHHRRKSGHGSANTSMTDVRKAASAADSSKHRSRPAALTRRSTPQSTYKLGKNPREREKEYKQQQQQQPWDDDEFDTFPQYCMACEKQFLPLDERCVYCSETCRKYDQNPENHRSTPKSGGGGGLSAAAYYPYYSTEDAEPRDIIPRASPSRPSSTYFPSSTTPGTSSDHSLAITALRSLSLQQQNSPPSPTVLPSGLWPFRGASGTSPSTVAAGGYGSRGGGAGHYSSTYDATYHSAAYGYGYGAGGSRGGASSSNPNGYNYSSSGMDRPLPSRKPGAYARPKSIELVTPMVGR